MLICIHSCVWNTIWLISLFEHVNISMKEMQVATKNQCEFIWNRFIGVYAFGFLFMLPQLFVNYKVRDYPSIIKTYLHLFSHWKWKCDEIFTTILYKILFFIFANLTIWFGILENYVASRSSFRRNFEGILHIWHASFIVIMFYLCNLCIIYCVICHYLICWGSFRHWHMCNLFCYWHKRKRYPDQYCLFD